MSLWKSTDLIAKQIPSKENLFFTVQNGCLTVEGETEFWTEIYKSRAKAGLEDE